MNDKAIQIAQANAISPLEQASKFLSDGGSMESLEKMMELQERFERNEAKKAYHVAMAEFKANPPKIMKEKNVSFGNTNYNHATLGKIVEEIGKALSENGLSSAWKTEQNDLIEVTCTITHILGYSESTTLKSGPDTSGKKNPIQAIGSTVTYLQRYTILALTGLATHEQDDDGQSSEPAKPEKPYLEQLAELKAADIEAYKTVCNKWQLDTLDGVTDEKSQSGMLQDLRLCSTQEYKDWGKLRDDNFDILEAWPDPVDVAQCVEAIKQAKIAIK